MAPDNACQREPNRRPLSWLRPWLRPRLRAHSNPLNSGWRAGNVIFGTQPGLASAERFCSKSRFHHPLGRRRVLAASCARLLQSDLTARVKRGRSHRRRRLATSFGPHGDPPTGNGVLGVYRTRESYAKAPPSPKKGRVLGRATRPVPSISHRRSRFPTQTHRSPALILFYHK